MKIKELLPENDITLEKFWEIVDALPDTFHGKKHKENIYTFFKKNGDPKSKALVLETDEDYQDLHTTQVFIRKQIRDQIHVARLKERRELRLKNIKDVKEKKDVPRRISKDNKLMPPKSNKGQRRIEGTNK